MEEGPVEGLSMTLDDHAKRSPRSPLVAACLNSTAKHYVAYTYPLIKRGTCPRVTRRGNAQCGKRP